MLHMGMVNNEGLAKLKGGFDECFEIGGVTRATTTTVTGDTAGVVQGTTSDIG